MITSQAPCHRVKTPTLKAAPTFQKKITIGKEEDINPIHHFYEQRVADVKKSMPSFVLNSYLCAAKSFVKRHIFPITKPIDPSLTPEEASKQKVTTEPNTWIGPIDRTLLFVQGKFNKAIEESNKNIKADDAGIFAEKAQSLTKELQTTPSETAGFVKKIIDTSEFLAQGTEMEINIEEGKLKQLAQSDEAAIYVFNHPNIPNDVILTFGFINQLYKAYEEEGKAETCPRISYLLDTDNLPPSFRDAAKSFGFNSLRAPLVDDGSSNVELHNGRVLFKSMREYSKGKKNIFLLPEGSYSNFKDIPLKEKFQPGIGRMVEKLVTKMDKVKIVPVGLCAEEGKGVVNIGEPIYFSHDDKTDGITATKGSLTPENAPDKGFYQNLSSQASDTPQTIVYGGEVITNDGKENKAILSRLVSGVVATNLDVNVQRATSVFKKVF